MIGIEAGFGVVDESRVRVALRGISYSDGAERRADDSFTSFEDALGYGLCRGCWIASQRLRRDYRELLGWAWLDTMTSPRVLVRNWERAGVSGLVNHFRWACFSGWRRAKDKRPDMTLGSREVPSGLWLAEDGGFHV